MVTPRRGVLGINMETKVDPKAAGPMVSDGPGVVNNLISISLLSVY